MTLEKDPNGLYRRVFELCYQTVAKLTCPNLNWKILNSEHDIPRRFENDGVLDVAITLDYQSIKEDVGADVKSLLNGFFKDGQDATN